MNGPELLAIAVASMAGSALSVWGVVRAELRAMREEVQRAHQRIDAFEGPRSPLRVVK